MSIQASEGSDLAAAAAADQDARMTEVEARALRAKHDTDARVLSRMTKAQLEITDRNELRCRGRERIYGRLSKDELISDILDLRYPRERLNEAIHVLYHKPGEVWSACEFGCAAGLAQTADGYVPR